MPKNLELYKRTQLSARKTLVKIAEYIHADSTETSIVETCIEFLADSGIHETWYYSTPAFVLLGNRSCLSISGRDYIPSTESVGETNLVTIDLSPMIESTWGDMARSFAVESGVAVMEPLHPEFKSGFDAERRLHESFCELASPDLTFDEVFSAMNQRINELGFVNLDFMGNVGHSIVERRENRVYFEAGNLKRLGDVEYFTFEPHIRSREGLWGFKHENIYYFDQTGAVCEL